MVEGGIFVVLKLLVDDLEKEDVYFTKEDVVRITSLSERSVARHLSSLVSKGLLVKSSGHQNKSFYRLSGGEEFVKFVKCCFD